MSSKLYGVLLLLFAAHNICDAEFSLKKPKIDAGLFHSVYYDPKTGIGLKGSLESSARNPLGRITFRGISCQCEKLACSCCTGVNITAIKLDQLSCTTFRYIPEDFAIKASLSINNKEIVSNSISAKNPPPVCASLPYLTFVSFCVRFFDVYTVGKNLHACVDVETRVTNAPILVLHFNCVQLGADGVSWSYPGSTNNVNIVQTQHNDNQPEVYDDVNFEPEDYEANANSTSSSQSPEDEAHIGQLKL